MRPALTRFMVVCAALGVLLVAGCSTVSPADGPSVVTVASGTGGNECSLTGEASAFPVGVPVHTVVSFSPPLSVGTIATITVTRDGTELPGTRQVFKITEPTPCIYFGLQHLEAGKYQVRSSIEPSSMPPATGEFEVTP